MGHHFCCKGWYSGSPYPSFRPLEKQCLQTTYSNSSRPHNPRCQINGGLVWWVYFYLASNCKQCLQTIYSNSSRPHNPRCQINGGLVWWVYFYLVLLTAFFATASVLVASVCLCRLEALVSLAVAYCPSCQLAFPGHLALTGGGCLAL